MATAQITVEAEADVIRRVEQLARARNTTVDAMVRKFLNAIVAINDSPFDETQLPPITKRAVGLLKGAATMDDREYKEILIDAITEKYEGTK